MGLVNSVHACRSSNPCMLIIHRRHAPHSDKLVLLLLKVAIKAWKGKRSLPAWAAVLKLAPCTHTHVGAS